MGRTRQRQRGREDGRRAEDASLRRQTRAWRRLGPSGEEGEKEPEEEEELT